MSRTRVLREVLLALGLTAFGLIVLPALVFVVGRQVVGEYPDGIGGLYAAVGDALAAGRGFAWFLVLSPYLCVLLVRLLLRLRPARQTVN